MKNTQTVFDNSQVMWLHDDNVGKLRFEGKPSLALLAQTAEAPQ